LATNYRYRKDNRLLEIRIFDDRTMKKVYEAQTNDAEAKGVSNCPLCAMESTNNRTRIWKLSEMDADHVTAWSRGGATDESNCQMLCKTHNRAKGNK
jgi:5-methylcytosine-specific restriction endonuclease McrA